MDLELVALSAGLPALALVWRVQDGCRNRSPLASVWASFLLGVLATLPALLIGTLVALWLLPALPEPWLAAGRAFGVAALPEEAIKLAALVGYAAAQSRFQGPREGLSHGIAVGLGFAIAENILHAGSISLETLVLRTFSVVPFHALLGAIMGFRVGRAVLRKGRHARELTRAFAIPAALHGLYDLCLFLAAERPAGPSGDPSFAAVALASTAVLIVLLSAGVVRRVALRLEREDPLDGSVHPAPRSSEASPSRLEIWARIVVGGLATSTGTWLVLGTWLYPATSEHGLDVDLALTLVRTGGASLAALGFVLANRGLRLRRQQRAAPERSSRAVEA